MERDHRGRPTRIADPAGSAQPFTWDADDRLLHRVTADGSRESWHWDPEGNCLAHTDAHGGVWATEYGHFDKPLARIAADGARHELRYDTELRLAQVTNPLGQKWSYTYDSAGRLVTEDDFDGRRTRYAYDQAGRLTCRTSPQGVSVAYTWDSMDRLTSRQVEGHLVRIVPVYAGANPIPIRLDFTAFGNKGFTFTHSLENPASGVRTGV
ncbi:RHS repeat domain-containing protein [Streptomyces sp. XY332]|uniref:RHS repeat domain-containing protein n=1 Tax=Streptomyces sp. XY332 TaxID=1415561 RepID=UPI0006B228EB|nr:RHS repeat domain-containing protein [Streptomyces sp. XY332]KOY50302.1 hypothetical protein ADK59_37980 [Streptomyces sp. XY332]